MIADTHFLLRDERYRPADADGFILSRWRALVGPNDTIWHLGDVGLASRSHRSALRDLLASLPGNVVLHPGNWDDPQVIEVCRQVGWEVRPRNELCKIGDGYALFSHYPEGDLADPFLSFHGHHHRPGEPPYEQSRRHINVVLTITET